MYIDMYMARQSKQGNYELLYILRIIQHSYNWCLRLPITSRITRKSPQAMLTSTRQINSYNNIVLQTMAMPPCNWSNHLWVGHQKWLYLHKIHMFRKWFFCWLMFVMNFTCYLGDLPLKHKTFSGLTV